MLVVDESYRKGILQYRLGINAQLYELIHEAFASCSGMKIYYDVWADDQEKAYANLIDKFYLQYGKDLPFSLPPRTSETLEEYTYKLIELMKG